MMLAEVTWREATQAQSLAELDAILDEIAGKISPDLPQAVQVVRSNGDCLTIVLGSEKGSILNFVAASGEPPYFSSMGNEKAAGAFTFFVAEDHHSEAPAWRVISGADAREAIRRFVQMSDGLPENVRWSID